MQIIVLAAPRSGASLVTRLVNLMGACFESGPVQVGFRNETPKGFWERADAVALNDRLLDAQGCRWDRLAGWNAARLPGKADASAGEIARIVQELDRKRPWVLKDPRLCLTLPAWRPHLATPVAIVVGRHPLETARSLQARDGLSLAHGMALWEYYATNCLAAVADIPTLFVGHRALVQEPMRTLARLREELAEKGIEGLALPGEKEVAALIDPALHRSRIEAGESELLSPRLLRLDRCLAGEEPLPPELREPSPLARDAMAMAGKRLAAEDRLRAANENFALSDQGLHATRNELEQHRHRSEAELARLHGTIAQYREQLLAVKGSLGWRFGRGLGTLFRRLTFRSRKADTPLPE